MASKKYGNCAICNEYKKLSFEHVPPESCFNDSPVFYQDYNNLIDKQSPYYGKKHLKNQGFGDFTLCEKCNNETGGWYGREYKEWVIQGVLVLKQIISNPNLIFYYNIKPLNVFKQILTMFMSAEKTDFLKDDKELVKFLLNPEEQNLHSKYKIFAYYSFYGNFKFLGFHFIGDFDNGKKFYNWAEISYPPFGYLLTIDSPPSHPKMMELTHFKNYLHNQSSSIAILMPLLESHTFLIGDYRTKKQINAGEPYGYNA